MKRALLVAGITWSVTGGASADPTELCGTWGTSSATFGPVNLDNTPCENSSCSCIEYGRNTIPCDGAYTDYGFLCAFEAPASMYQAGSAPGCAAWCSDWCASIPPRGEGRGSPSCDAAYFAAYETIGCTGAGGGACGTGAGDPCSGIDDDGDGEVDEGCADGDPSDSSDCAAYVGDPVHVGTGAFVTDSYVDVRYEGTALPMEFVRRYTSNDAWRDSFGAQSTRLARGWFHTYDERLFAGDSGADISDLETYEEDAEFPLIHRTPRGVGRQFLCPDTFTPTTDFDCTSSDGSLDVLSWDATNELWVLQSARGPLTRFHPNGELHRKELPRGAWWEVHYHASGDFDGYIDYVEDHLGRELHFEWDIGTPASTRNENAIYLARLYDLTGSTETTLATFETTDSAMRLIEASSAAGEEEYEYLDTTRSGYATVHHHYLTVIRRDGEEVTTVDYAITDDDFTKPYVTSVVAQDGSYAFRRGTGADVTDVCGTSMSDRLAQVTARSRRRYGSWGARVSCERERLASHAFDRGPRVDCASSGRSRD